MSNFLYTHPDDNIAPDATVTIQTGTADSSYPVANATDVGYAKIAAPSKLTGVTGAWQMDYGSAVTKQGFLLWHNCDGALAVSLQANTAASWASPAFSKALTIPNKRADGSTVKVFIDLRPYLSTAYRYWRLNVSGANTDPLGVKWLAFSQLRSLTRNMRWGYNITRRRPGISMATDALVRWAYPLGPGARRLSAELIPTSADLLALDEWFRACDGSTTPSVMVPIPSNCDGWLGVLNAGGDTSGSSELSSTHEFVDFHRASLTFDEITAGDPEWD